jgi:hypothetical protein
MHPIRNQLVAQVKERAGKVSAKLLILRARHGIRTRDFNLGKLDVNLNLKSTLGYHRPPRQQACQQLAFGPHLIKPEAMIFLQQCVDRSVHRSGSPDFARWL